MTGVENVFICYSGSHKLGPVRQLQQICRAGKPPGHISTGHLDRAFVTVSLNKKSSQLQVTLVNKLPLVSFECPLSVQIHPQCPSKALQVPFKRLSSALQVHFQCLLGVLRVKKFFSFTDNGLLNSFIEFFKNFSEYVCYLTLVVDSFLRNKMSKLSSCKK